MTTVDPYHSHDVAELYRLPTVFTGDTLADQVVLVTGAAGGIGSAITVLAARLGATVDACDLDPAAIEATAANARANAVPLAVRLGTLGGLDGGYDVVVANLLAPALISLAEPLRASLAPGATLVVSGLLAGRWAHVASALEPLVLERIDEHDCWSALTLRRGPEQALPAR